MCCSHVKELDFLSGGDVVRGRYSSRVTKVPFAELRRLLIVTESPSVIRKRRKKRNNKR